MGQCCSLKMDSESFSLFCLPSLLSPSPLSKETLTLDRDGYLLHAKELDLLCLWLIGECDLWLSLAVGNHCLVGEWDAHCNTLLLGRWEWDLLFDPTEGEVTKPVTSSSSFSLPLSHRSTWMRPWLPLPMLHICYLLIWNPRKIGLSLGTARRCWSI